MVQDNQAVIGDKRRQAGGAQPEEWLVCRQCDIEIRFPASARDKRMFCPRCKTETLPSAVSTFRDVRACSINVFQKYVVAIGCAAAFLTCLIAPGTYNGVFESSDFVLQTPKLLVRLACVIIPAAGLFVLGRK